MKSAICVTSAIAAGLLLSGCMQARIEESREMATPLAKGERVVILAKPQIEGAGAEDDFMDCVGSGLGGRNGVAVHDNNEFVDRMFPWFEPSTAPARPEAVSALLARPGVADQVTTSAPPRLRDRSSPFTSYRRSPPRNENRASSPVPVSR